MTRLAMVTGKQSSQLVALRSHLFDLRAPPALVVRMQRNAQRALEERKNCAPELLEMISEPLRKELHFEVFAPVLFTHPFFAFYRDVNPAGVRRLCHSAVQQLHFMRGDVIFGDYETPPCPSMLF